VVLEKDGEDQLDRSCEKLKSVRKVKEDMNILPTVKRSEANWIGHTLRGNCLLKHVFEGNLEGRIGVTERRERRRCKLLDDLEKNRGYRKLKKRKH
jgi:hypothetical protein